jgi:hypothetical protein
MKCVNCDKLTDNPKFCSRSCGVSYNNKAKPKRTKRVKFCLFCNKEYPYRLRNRKFCSKQCHYEYKIEKIVKLMDANIESIEDKTRLRPEKSEVFRLFGSNEKLKTYTDWDQKYTLEQGLKETIEWFSTKENLQQYKSDIYNV